MNPKALMQVIRAIEGHLGAFFREFCFVEADRHMWLRRWGWKTDVIRMFNKVRFGLLINFEVWLPPSPTCGLTQSEVGYTSLGYLMGSRYASCEYPRWFGSGELFTQSVVSAFPLAVAWFDGYDSPSKCISRMLTPHVNPNSRGFHYQQEYLHRLPAELEHGACLLSLSHEFKYAYSRALFDVHYRGRLPSVDHIDDEDAE